MKLCVHILIRQNNINHQEEIEYEMVHYAKLSYTRSDAGPKPYGSGEQIYKSVSS